MAEAATVAGVAAKAAGRGTERVGNDEASPKVDKRGTTILVPIGLVIVCAVMVALMAQRPGHADTGPWQWDGTARCSEVAGTASVQRVSIGNVVAKVSSSRKQPSSPCGMLELGNLALQDGLLLSQLAGDAVA